MVQVSSNPERDITSKAIRKEAHCLPESILKVVISSDDTAVPFNEILISNFMDFVANRIWLVHIFTAYFN